MPTRWKHWQAKEKVDRLLADLNLFIPELVARFPRPLDELVESSYPVSFVEVENLTLQKIISYLDGVGIKHDLHEEPDTSDPLAGFALARNGHGLLFSESQGEAGFILFTKAHELGHFLDEYWYPYIEAQNSRSVGTLYACRDLPGSIQAYAASAPESGKRKRLSAEELREAKANLFAAELLMPADQVEEIAKEESEQESLIQTIHSRFGVSLAAARTRLYDLKLLEQETTS